MTVARLARPLALALALLVGPGCTSFWSVAETDGTLEDTMRTYTKLVRWGERERAALFVDEAVRPEFEALSPEIDRLRFTDFDMGPVAFEPHGEDGQIASVTVVYRAYDVRTLVEREIVETQRWIPTGTNTWKVEPDLSGFRGALGREPAR